MSTWWLELHGASIEVGHYNTIGYHGSPVGRSLDWRTKDYRGKPCYSNAGLPTQEGKLNSACSYKIINVHCFCWAIGHPWLNFTLPPQCPHLPGAIEGEIEPNLPRGLTTSWQIVTSWEKVPWNTLSWPGMESGAQRGQRVRYIHIPTEQLWLSIMTGLNISRCYRYHWYECIELHLVSWSHREDHCMRSQFTVSLDFLQV